MFAIVLAVFTTRVAGSDIWTSKLWPATGAEYSSYLRGKHVAAHDPKKAPPAGLWDSTFSTQLQTKDESVWPSLWGRSNADHTPFDRASVQESVQAGKIPSAESDVWALLTSKPVPTLWKLDTKRNISSSGSGGDIWGTLASRLWDPNIERNTSNSDRNGIWGVLLAESGALALWAHTRTSANSSSAGGGLWDNATSIWDSLVSVFDVGAWSIAPSNSTLVPLTDTRINDTIRNRSSASNTSLLPALIPIPPGEQSNEQSDDVNAVAPANTTRPATSKLLRCVFVDKGLRNTGRYSFATRTMAVQACGQRGYSRLCVKAELEGIEECAAGWMGDFVGYWMSEGRAGCEMNSGRGFRTWKIQNSILFNSGNPTKINGSISDTNSSKSSSSSFLTAAASATGGDNGGGGGSGGGGAAGAGAYCFTDMHEEGANGKDLARENQVDANAWNAFGTSSIWDDFGALLHDKDGGEDSSTWSDFQSPATSS